jgi:hypothetical protein
VWAVLQVVRKRSVWTISRTDWTSYEASILVVYIHDEKLGCVSLG